MASERPSLSARGCYGQTAKFPLPADQTGGRHCCVNIHCVTALRRRDLSAGRYRGI
jgi:hypothetical protein